jgi:hypothetical protein
VLGGPRWCHTSAASWTALRRHHRGRRVACLRRGRKESESQGRGLAKLNGEASEKPWPRLPREGSRRLWRICEGEKEVEGLLGQGGTDLRRW